ncbi:MAG: aminotransferase class V-fold PLP-dependent enzyme [Bacteroidota bacterium]
MSNQIFFTPGPAQTFYTYEQHLKTALKEDIPSISHRSKAFQEIFASTVENLKTLFDLPDGYHIYFTASATEVWERIIQNLVNDNSHHFVNGSFSSRFHDIATAYQIKATKEEVAPGSGFSLDLPDETELIAVTQNETSIGYNFPEQEIYQLADTKPKDALLAVDIVSCAPAVALDFSKVDTAYFSVQKSFGLPAGLGVWIVNERCLEKAAQKEEQGKITGSYHRLSQLQKYAVKNQTPETPNVLAIYLLGKVAQDMLYRGVQQLRNETIYKSAILYQTMAELDWISPFIEKDQYRSKTVGVGKLNGITSSKLIEQMQAKKLILGQGYGNFKEDHVRIANFPTHSKEQMEMLVDLLAAL